MAGTCTVPATDGSASPARVEGACGSPVIFFPPS